MEYKGYVATVTYDAGDRVLHGRIAGIRDLIAFHGESVATIEQAFHEAVDDYLAWCAEDGREPEQPFSGKLLLRTTPAVHRALVQAAAGEGKSLNAWVVEQLARVVDAA